MADLHPAVDKNELSWPLSSSSPIHTGVIRQPSAMLRAMVSWRDTASDEAQADLDGLLNAVLPFAEQTIAKYGELFPFGASVNTSGDLAMLAADPAIGEQPASNEVLQMLRQGVQRSLDTTRAVAFVVDVLVEGSDAIRMEMEHREGTAIVVLAPYTHSRFNKSVTLGQMSVSAAPLQVWTGA
jgi:hypothetical protein